MRLKFLPFGFIPLTPPPPHAPRSRLPLKADGNLCSMYCCGTVSPGGIKFGRLTTNWVFILLARQLIVILNDNMLSHVLFLDCQIGVKSLSYSEVNLFHRWSNFIAGLAEIFCRRLETLSSQLILFHNPSHAARLIVPLLILHYIL